jgi:hypothetical protein
MSRLKKIKAVFYETERNFVFCYREKDLFLQKILDRGALSLSIPEEGHTPDENAAMYQYPPELLSFFLGTKSPSDDQNMTPNPAAVRSSTRFAIAAGRLDAA